MAYTVKSSEQHRKSGADAETKALLYLMNFHADSKEVHFFVVDFFNDLTGMNRMSTKLWDIQSKAVKNNGATALGREMVTLLKNYLSSFDFVSYILFVGGVTDTLRIDNSIDVFGIENLTEKARKNLLNGLRDEADKREYIDSDNLSEETLDSFLKNVCFVVDNKPPQDYVRAIIQEHPAIIPDEETLIAIFEEIKQKQASKKDASKVEGVTIDSPDEALSFCRHIKSNEVKMLTLQRILHKNPFEKGIPLSFVSVIANSTTIGKEEIRDQCQLALSRALFNPNLSDEFWTLFERVYELICENPKDEVQDIYRKLDRDTMELIPDFDSLSLKYFIATIKDGINK